MLPQIQTLSVRSSSVLESVFHFDRSATANLQTIMHGAAGGKGIGPEACGRIVHFQFVNILSAVILNLGVDPVALAAGGGEQGDSCG